MTPPLVTAARRVLVGVELLIVGRLDAEERARLLRGLVELTARLGEEQRRDGGRAHAGSVLPF